MEELLPQDIEEFLQELEDEYDTEAARVERHLQRAYAHLRSEQFQDALHECDLAIQLDPTRYEAHNLRGLVLAELGRKQEASGAFREALRLKPDFQAARTNLQEIEAVPAEDADASLETQGKRFGIRAGAYIIDAVAYLVLTNITKYVVAFFLSVVLTLAGREFYFEERSLCLNLSVGLVLSALYFAIFEWLYGASLGKLVLRMCVVMENGERCTFGAALLRAGLRYVDGLFLGIPAYATMKPPLYQRIGDKSAKTIVVDAKDPAIRQPRAGRWFLVAVALYLALDSITSLLLLAPTVRLGGATVRPVLPTPIPVATFPAAAPTPAPPVAEAMRQLDTGWTSHLTEADVADNLPPGVVLAGGFWTGIAVASDGTLWFSTLGGGVFRFDGETWTYYSEEDGLASNIVLDVAEGPDGALYFATAEGVCRFDGESWRSYPESAHLAGGPGVIAWASDGTLWYGTAKGVTRFDGESWTTYTVADGLAANYLLGIVVAPDGALWFATNGGVSRFDGETWATYTIADGLAHNRVASLAVAPDGALWFATEGGVSRFAGETWTTYTTADGLVNDDVNAVMVAPDGVLWFGTEGGVSRFDGQTWTTYTTTDGLVNESVWAIAQAPDGALWFSTSGGVSRYVPPEGTTPSPVTASQTASPTTVPPVPEAMRQLEPGWTSYTSADEAYGLGSDHLSAIAVDRDGALWFGTWDGDAMDIRGGVSRFDGQTWTTYTAEDGLAHDWVSSIAVNGEGVLWFGTREGVSRFDGQTWTTYTTEDGLAHNWVSAVAVDGEGALWVGTRGGVSRFDGQTWTTYTTEDGLADNGVQAIAVDREGALWFGTWNREAMDIRGGVSRFDGQTWTTYTVEDGLAHNTVWAIAVDRDGALWFGTHGGVTSFDGQNWTTYTEEDPLGSGWVSAIAVDGDGALWFGRDSGVSRFDGQNWTSYTEEDGLVSSVVLAIAEDGDGALWFGTEAGISRYMPPVRSAPTPRATFPPSESGEPSATVEELSVGTWRLISILSQPVEAPCDGVTLTFRSDATTTAISGELEIVSSYVIHKEDARYRITVTWMSDNGKPNCQGIPADQVRERGSREYYAEFGNGGEILRMFREPTEEEPFLTYERVD